MPKKIRKMLVSNIITKPINSVGGSLKNCNKNTTFKDARNKAWEGVASDYKS